MLENLNAVSNFGLTSGGDASTFSANPLPDVFGIVKPKLQQVASNSELFSQIFGDKANTTEILAVRSQWAIGNFSQLPSVQVISAPNMNGADGGYSSFTQNIYLSDALFQPNAASVNSLLGAAGVLVEETFHWLDDRVGEDTKGDEGELAKNLIFGVNLTPDQITVLKAEDDHGFITVNNQLTAVELSSPSDFGINLGSTSYTKSGGNVFIAGVLDNCTEFAFGRALEKGLITSGSGIGAKIRGHAGQWDDQAGSWSSKAKANSFAVWDANTGGALADGHVAFVERVNSDGSFVVSEFNWNNGDGKFNSRPITLGSNSFNTAKFIYLDSNNSQVNNDFNKDGASDILWRKNDGTAMTYWSMGGTTPLSVNLGGTDPNWSVIGTGDFNKDGASDILWRKNDGTAMTYWSMGGTTPLSVNLGGTDPNWSVIGTGDFNKDGASDILWRKNDGTAMTYWSMGGATPLSVNLGATDPNWSVIGTGDFNKDGASDILWRKNDGTAMTYWGMGGTTPVNVNLGATDPNWSVIGTGDFNKDGASDILWRKNDGTAMTYWGMGGTTPVNVNLGATDPNWSVTNNIRSISPSPTGLMATSDSLVKLLAGQLNGQYIDVDNTGYYTGKNGAFTLYQCWDLVASVTGNKGSTSNWKQGVNVIANGRVAVGTAIATFKGANSSYYGHTAIFGGYGIENGVSGFYVWDQNWDGSSVQRHFIKTNGSSAYNSNANEYYVVRV